MVNIDGEELRRVRKSLGLSQAAVAVLVGVPSTHIGRWERGDAGPSQAEVDALAAALSLDPRSLVRRSGRGN